MADSDAKTIRPDEKAANADSTKSGFDRAKGIFAELADAARAVAESLADEQRERAAEQAAAVAAAVRCAAQSLDRSQSPALARCAVEAAGRMEDFSRAVRERRWRDIVADTAAFARRRPALYVLAAVAVGFGAGRALSASPDRRRQKDDAGRGHAIGITSDLGPHRGETDEITAAVANPAMTPTGGNGLFAGNLGSASALRETH